jgi:PAS domain S-box-containing protein
LQTLASNLGSLLTGSDIGVLVLDSRLHIVRFTLAAANLFQLASSHEGAPFLRVASNLGDVTWKTLLADVTRVGKRSSALFSTGTAWFSLRMKPFLETRNGATGVLLVLLDENEVRRSLHETRNSLGNAEDTVRMLLDVSPKRFLPSMPVTRSSGPTKQRRQCFGHSLPELLGQTIEVLISPAARKRHRTHRKRFFAAIKARPRGLSRELQGLRNDGSSFPIEISVTKTRAATTLAFVTDITVRKRLEQAVRQRENELSALVNSSPDTHLRFDPNLRITHANAAIGKRIGVPPQAMVGKRCADLPFPPANVRVGELILRKVFRTGRPQRSEFTLPSAEGETHHETRFVPELSLTAPSRRCSR